MKSTHVPVNSFSVLVERAMGFTLILRMPNQSPPLHCFDAPRSKLNHQSSLTLQLGYNNKSLPSHPTGHYLSTSCARLLRMSSPQRFGPAMASQRPNLQHQGPQHEETVGKTAWDVLCEIYPTLRRLESQKFARVGEELRVLASRPPKETFARNPKRSRRRMPFFDFIMPRTLSPTKQLLTQISGNVLSDAESCTWCKSGEAPWLGCVPSEGGGQCMNCHLSHLTGCSLLPGMCQLPTMRTKN